jgi:hypothetical protein
MLRRQTLSSKSAESLALTGIEAQRGIPSTLSASACMAHDPSISRASGLD